MFHAHKTEFAEKGWMGLFLVKDDEKPDMIPQLSPIEDVNSSNL
jgi:hypothetical protein